MAKQTSNEILNKFNAILSRLSELKLDKESIDLIINYHKNIFPVGEGRYAFHIDSVKCNVIGGDKYNVHVNCECKAYNSSNLIGGEAFCVHTIAVYVRQIIEYYANLINSGLDIKNITIANLKTIEVAALKTGFIGEYKVFRIEQDTLEDVFLFFTLDQKNYLDIVLIKYEKDLQFKCHTQLDTDSKEHNKLLSYTIGDLFVNVSHIKAAIYPYIFQLNNESILEKYGINFSEQIYQETEIDYTNEQPILFSKSKEIKDLKWLPRFIKNVESLIQKDDSISESEWGVLLRELEDDNLIFSLVLLENDAYSKVWPSDNPPPINTLALGILKEFELNYIKANLYSRLDLLASVWDLLHYYNCKFFLHPSGRLSKNSVKSRVFSKRGLDIQIQFSVEYDLIVLRIVSNLQSNQEGNISIISKLIIDTGEVLMIPANITQAHIISQFNSQGVLSFSSKLLNELFQFLNLLSKQFRITSANNFPIEIADGELSFIVDITATSNKNELNIQKSIQLDGNAIQLKDNENGVLIKTDHKFSKDYYYIINREQIKEFDSIIDSLTLNCKKSSSENNILIDKEKAFENLWLGEFVQQLRSYDYTVKGMDKFKNIEFNQEEPTLEQDIYEEISWFEVRINVYFGSNKVRIDELMRAIKNGFRTIKLDDGTLGLITDELIDKINSLKSRATNSDSFDSFKISKANLVYLEELALASNKVDLLNKVRSQIDIINNYNNNKAIPIPQSVKADLRPYQSTGFQFLATIEALGMSPLLADEMGLGKTIQAILVLAYLQEKYGEKFKGALIIAPVSLLSNWEEEIRKFCPSLTTHIYHGSNKELMRSKLKSGQIIITSYNTVRMEVEHFTQIVWQATILDEAHNIKNPSSKATLAINEIKSDWRLALTGTPVENSAMDAYSIFSFLNPGLLGSKESFNSYYNNPINKGDASKAELLKKTLAPLILRRTKSEVIRDLPSKTETIIYCELEKEQRAFYEAYRRAILAEISVLKKTNPNAVSIQCLKGISALRQICNHPMLAPDRFVATGIPSAKLDFLNTQLSEIIPNHKVLIFSNYKTLLDLVGKNLEDQKISYLPYHGSLTVKKRKQNIAAFKDERKGISAMLMTIKAGGVGLTLTDANYVIIFDPWWNPAIESQAIDRTHRIGQRRHVNAYKYICKDTVEEKILILQNRKTKIFESLISGNEAEIIKTLSLEDLEYILS